MGASGPKRSVADRLFLLEDEVNDAVLTGHTDDKVLDTLLDITIASIKSDREVFPNPLTEPIFYRRHFKKWVQQSLEERALLEQALNKDNSPS
jgi:hypothetical protein